MRVLTLTTGKIGLDLFRVEENATKRILRGPNSKQLYFEWLDNWAQKSRPARRLKENSTSKVKEQHEVHQRSLQAVERHKKEVESFLKKNSKAQWGWKQG